MWQELQFLGYLVLQAELSSLPEALVWHAGALSGSSFPFRRKTKDF